MYILECSDGSYYTGITSDLELRLFQHDSGYFPSCYTFKRRPLILKYFEHFTIVEQAIAREKQVKGWSRKKKEALFRQDWNALIELAKSRKKQDVSTSTSSV
jgi:putative endonuclease